MISIGAVARQTGIDAETLRKWQLRYGFPAPQRSESGQRMFQASDVEKIHMVARAMAQGQRTRHAIEGVLAVVQQPTQTEKHKPKQNNELETTLELLKSDNVFRLQEALESTFSRMGMAAFVEDFALPLINLVGAQWQAGLLPVYREHTFSSLLSNLVARNTQELACGQSLHPSLNATRPILLALPAGEHHNLALILFNALLREAGLPTLVMQSGLPASELADAAKAYESRIVALSCSAASPPKLLHSELSELRQLLPASVEMWVGGAGALRLPSGIEGVIFNHSMRASINRALAAVPTQRSS